MSNQKLKVAIVGASGFTGSELARILLHHEDVSIEMITSESHVGKPFSDLHPQFFNRLDLPLETADEVTKAELDVIFLALPHGVSMDFVAKWKDSSAKIIDLSGDFRLSTKAVYEEWYNKTHTYPAGFETAVYGLPELYSGQIKGAGLIANPGCFPTASILSMAPLYAKQLVEKDSLIIDAKSGLTGAGIKATATTHFSNVNENFKAYGIASHRHTIEIEEQLGAMGGGQTNVQFTPHLLPVDRGILVTAYAKLTSDMSQAKLTAIYKDFYKDKPFVRVRKEAPGIKDVRGSHYCDVFPVWDARTKRVISVAAIDNLLKGAASQAVHNMNILFGLAESEGLSQVPLKP